MHRLRKLTHQVLELSKPLFEERNKVNLAYLGCEDTISSRSADPSPARPLRISARHLRAFAQCRSFCFFKRLSASLIACLLFKLSRASYTGRNRRSMTALSSFVPTITPRHCFCCCYCCCCCGCCFRYCCSCCRYRRFRWFFCCAVVAVAVVADLVLLLFLSSLLLFLVLLLLLSEAKRVLDLIITYMLSIECFVRS